MSAASYEDVPRYQVPARRGLGTSHFPFDSSTSPSWSFPSSCWRRNSSSAVSSSDCVRSSPPAYSIDQTPAPSRVPFYPEPAPRWKMTDEPAPYNAAYPHPLSIYASRAVNPHAVAETTYERDLMHLLETNPDLVKGTILASYNRAAVPIPGLHLIGVDDEGNPMGCGIPERIYHRFESYGAARLPVTAANPAAEASSNLSTPTPTPRLPPRLESLNRSSWLATTFSTSPNSAHSTDNLSVPSSVRFGSGEENRRQHSHSSSVSSVEHSSVPRETVIESPWHKTEMCRSFEENGDCKYGAQCQFAHGTKELRPPTSAPPLVLPGRLVSHSTSPSTATALGELASAAMARKGSLLNNNGAVPPVSPGQSRHIESRRASAPPSGLDVVEEDEHDGQGFFVHSPDASHPSSHVTIRPGLSHKATAQLIPKLDVHIEHRASPDSANSLSAQSEPSSYKEYDQPTSSLITGQLEVSLALRPRTSASSLSNSVSSRFSAPTFPNFTPFSPAQAHARAQSSAAEPKSYQVWQSTFGSSVSQSSASAPSAKLMSPIDTTFASQRGGDTSSPTSSSTYGIGSEQRSSAKSYGGHTVNPVEIKHRTSYANLSAVGGSDDGSSTSLDFTTGKSIWSWSPSP